MLTWLIQEHTSYLRSNIQGPAIVAYKGFPNSFITKINEAFPHILGIDIAWTDGLDLHKIQTLSREYARALMLLDNEDIRCLFYEELLFIDSKISIPDFFKWSVVVIENPLLEYVPNQSNLHFPDIEGMMEKDNLRDGDAEELWAFYSNSAKRSDTFVLQYKSISEDTPLKEVNFFETIETKNFIPSSWNDHSGIFISLSDPAYEKLAYDYFLGKIDADREILLRYDDTVDLQLVNAIHTAFTSDGIELRIWKSESGVPTTKHYRKEFDEILKETWWYESFRKIEFYENPDLSNTKTNLSQGVLIEDIVSQVEASKKWSQYSDIIITAPTGAGKSVIFQVPAIYLAREYWHVTIVVSPLIALMYDQVSSLKAKGVLIADYINSEKNLEEREEILQKIKAWEISILYLSPELLLSYDISHFIGDRKIGLLVIDEAHLVTTWGRDFRVDYWYLWNYISKVRKYNEEFVTLALTATAVYGWEDDMVFETIRSLNMKLPTHKYIWNVVRDDIEFHFEPFEYAWNYNTEREDQTKNVIKKRCALGIKTLVYFPYERHIKQIYAQLGAEGYSDKVWMYYGNLDKATKKQNLDDFKSGKIKVMLATKAFWMWIDIDDIKVVYHHAPSWSVPDYVQEIWRAARKNWLKWRAEIDYCSKDLNFAKALHGLSSIKQYECRLVLEKIHQIYELKNRARKIAAEKGWTKYRMQQNFLVSIEDFKFIFSEDANIENKVKNVLLLIEKDLLKKYKFNVLVARPKQLFTTAFISIDRPYEEDFKREYGHYVQISKNIEDNQRVDRYGNGVRDTWNIYSIDLQKLWEERFLYLSFPMLKKELYDWKLFKGYEGRVSPRFKLSINLRHDHEITARKLNEYFSSIEQIFSSEIFYHRYAKEHELDKRIAESFQDRSMRIKIKEVLLSYYANSFNFSWNGRIGNDNFIQIKRDADGTKTYRLIDSSFSKVKLGFLRHFEEMFRDQKFERFLSINKWWDFRLKIASVLELLDLWTYEVEGWEFPKVFIRLNDPFKVRQICTSGKYSNSIVQDIERRYKRSIRYIDAFFTEMPNERRWSFIEDYFLWRPLREFGEMEAGNEEKTPIQGVVLDRKIKTKRAVLGVTSKNEPPSDEEDDFGSEEEVQFP